jgi:hypothetical protein
MEEVLKVLGIVVFAIGLLFVGLALKHSVAYPEFGHGLIVGWVIVLATAGQVFYLAHQRRLTNRVWELLWANCGGACLGLALATLFFNYQLHYTTLLGLLLSSWGSYWFYRLIGGPALREPGRWEPTN